MTFLSRTRLPALAAGFSLLLAPPSLAQLAPTEGIAGVLGTSEDPRFCDYTGDGLLDVLALSETTSDSLRLSLFPALSANEFGQQQQLLSLEGDLELAAYLATDIDADGDIDIWFAVRAPIASMLPLEVTSYLNDGQGKLTAGGTWTANAINVVALESIDLDGDGIADLRISSETGGDGFFPGQPGGALGSFRKFFSGAHPHGALKIGDVDGDGDPDFVASNAPVAGLSQRQVVAYLNTGVFPIDPSVGTIVTSAAGTERLTLSDLDGDGDADLLVQPLSSSIPTQLFESLGGTFQLRGASLPGSPFLYSTQLTDLDGDGDDDILTDRASSGLQWAENLGGLVFAPEVSLSTELRAPAATADLNGDGLPEFLQFVSDFSGTYLWIQFPVLHAGGIALDGPQVLLSDFPGREAPLAIADFDGDDLDDIVFFWSPPQGLGPFADENEIGWKRALGGGEFSQTTFLAGIGSNPFQIAPVAGDFDGDGNADILYLRIPDNDLVLLRGDGAGGFPGTPISSPIPPLAYAGVEPADMNGDGVLDVILQASVGLNAVSMIGTPSGVFQEMGTSVGSLQSSKLVVAADMNGDDRNDLLFVASPIIELALQTASGDFAPRTAIVDATDLDQSWSLVRPSAFDVDEDGTVDLLVPVGSTLQWARGLGSGAFAPLQLLLGGTGPKFRRVLATRVDPDAKPDLVMHRLNVGSPHSWARNLGGGTFAAFELAPGPAFPGTLNFLLLDADGDGDQDLLCSNFNGPLVLTENLANGPRGTNYCLPAVPNSTGLPGRMAAFGSDDLTANALTLRALDLPPNQFGFFLVGPNQGFVPTVPNSIGTLCLSGSIGRFNRPGELQFSGGLGLFSLPVDLGSIPTPSGGIPVLPGETWNFQAWHRDSDGAGGTTSNFTDGLEVDF